MKSKKIIMLVLSIVWISMGSRLFAQSRTGQEQVNKVKRTAIIGADPLGVALKDTVKAVLLEEGFEVVDITGQDEQSYVDVGYRIGKAISEKKYDFGFVFCGTGMGVNLVANKFNGVYCALCESIETARLSRVINNANVLSMGGLVVTPYLGKQIVSAFINTAFTKEFSEAGPQFLNSAYKRVVDMDSVITKYNYERLEK